MILGLVYAEIDLINGEDLVLARRNCIGEDEIKEDACKYACR